MLKALALLLCPLAPPALRLSSEPEAREPGRCVVRPFGSTPYLEGVQYMPTLTEHLPFVNFSHGSGDKEGLFVYPKSHVAMCIIEKNGCTTWTTLFNKLTRSKVQIQSAWYGVVPFHWSPQNASEVFHDPQSSRILWVREPLERFLSGFLDKCATFHDFNYYHICGFHWTRQQKPGFPLSQVLEWYRAGHRTSELDSHFTPQSWHCELGARLREYNLIGLMTKANFTMDAACILKKANLSYINEKGGKTPGKPFLNQVRAPDFELKERRRIEVLKKFFTKELAYFLMDVYEEDYKLFRIQKPTWVEEATGEWYDVAPTSTPALSPKTGEAELMQDHPDAQEASSWEDAPNEEDDIVELAARAGFRLEEEGRVRI